ncbi:MAG: D-alanine--D-alanine ligase family protein [Thermoleophilia bacterium]
MLQLALIFGGRSAEHEISVASARFVAQMLDRDAYEVVPVGITRGGRWVRPLDVEAALRDGLDDTPCEAVHLEVDPARPGLVYADGSFQPLDFAFPMMHGTFAEDGTIQGLLELAGLAYAGSGVTASAVGMDKEAMKDVFAARGLPQVEYLTLRDEAATGAGAVAAVEDRLAYPVFVKPVNLGSSVGMTKAHDRAELGPALELAAAYDRKVIVEAACAGRELECAVLGNEEPHASVAGEVIPANEFYDYEAKYTEGLMAFVIPADVGPEMQAEVARLTVAAFSAIDGCGFARCDFFLEAGSGRVLVNEINTIPGMTAMSGFPRLWAASGLDGPALVEEIVQLGLRRHAARRDLRTTH